MTASRLRVSSARNWIGRAYAQRAELGRGTPFRPALALVALVALLPRGAPAAMIQAVWRGGIGSWTDAHWAFDLPPASAAFPSNDGSDLFDVKIDGGLSGTDSIVTLAGQVEVDRLAVDAGDALAIASQGRLTLVRDAARPLSGVIENDGTIALSNASVALLAQGDLSLEGSGVLELGGGRIAPTGDFNIVLAHGPGHTIRGSGEIDLAGSASGTGGALLANAGTIEATGASPLRIIAISANDGVLRATGGGGLELLGQGTNRGVIEVGAGSRLTTAVAPFANLGEIRIIGPGSSATASLANGGLVEVAQGGLLQLISLSSTFAASPTLRVASSGELRLPSIGAVISQGRLLLEDGLVTSVGGGLGVSSSGRLEGSGRLVFTAPISISRLLNVSGAIAPGGTGSAGAIDVSGRFGLSSAGRFELELGGTAPSAFDRLTATEAAEIRISLGTTPTIDVSLLPGFEPQTGDAFEILRAASIVEPGLPLARIFAVPVLAAPDLFLVPELSSGAGTGSLFVRAKQALAATWSGGRGDYGDAARWSFSATPAAGAVLPSNDAANLFDVRIDGGHDGTPAEVLLAGAAMIDHLAVDANARLSLGEGARLGFSDTPMRAASGRITNDGTITLAGAAANLDAAGDLSIDGGGVLELGGGRIGTTGAFNIVIAHGPGHTIRGSGEIDLVGSTTPPGATTLANAGAIEATGAAGLRIDALVENAGALRASGGGGLALSGHLTNRGLVEIVAGSALATGGLTQDGQGALIRISSGELRVAQATQGLQRSVDVSAGRVELAGGTLSFANPGFGEILVQQTALLGGRGVIAVSGTNLRVQDGGRIAPGLEEVGVLEITGGLSLRSGGALEIQLAGTTPEIDFDVLSVLGTSSLAGSIEVALLAFSPSLGDAFDVLRSTAIVDQGFALKLPGLAEGLAWERSIVATDAGTALRLVVTPEPGTGLLLSAGLAALATGARGRRAARAKSRGAGLAASPRAQAGRKWYVRTIVSSRFGPIEIRSTGTPTSASTRSTYCRAVPGRSSQRRQPVRSSVQPAQVA